MRTSRLTVLLAVLCVGGWTVSAQAEQGLKDKDNSFHHSSVQPGMGGSQGAMSDSGGKHLAPALMTAPNEQQFQGKILGYKDVDVEGDKDHRVLRIQTREGKTVMVDLGREDRLPDGLEIREGQWVIVTGVSGQLGNDKVLVAHNLANIYNFMPGAASLGGAKLDEDTQNLHKEVPVDKDVQRETKTDDHVD